MSALSGEAHVIRASSFVRFWPYSTRDEFEINA
jgi:hypothetical protein